MTEGDLDGIDPERVVQEFSLAPERRAHDAGQDIDPRTHASATGGTRGLLREGLQLEVTLVAEVFAQRRIVLTRTQARFDFRMSQHVGSKRFGRPLFLPCHVGLQKRRPVRFGPVNDTRPLLLAASRAATS